MNRKQYTTIFALSVAILTGYVHAQDTPWAPPTTRTFEISKAFAIPNGIYNAGHRGIDIPTINGEQIFSPTDAIVVFSDMVVDRPVLSLETASGNRISFEPLASELSRGSVALRGTPIGTVAHGGHCGRKCLHIGVRAKGRYCNPARWFRAKPVLLPYTQQRRVSRAQINARH